MTETQLKTLLSLVDNRLQVEAISIRRVLRENPDLWREVDEMLTNVAAEIVEPSAPPPGLTWPMNR